MDLTEITIAPMIPMGIAVATVKTCTGWGWPASVAAGLIPGALIGFLVGLLFYVVVSWILARADERSKPGTDGPE